MKRSVIKLTNPDRWLITSSGTYEIVDEISEEDYVLWKKRELQVLEDTCSILED